MNILSVIVYAISIVLLLSYAVMSHLLMLSRDSTSIPTKQAGFIRLWGRLSFAAAAALAVTAVTFAR